MLRREFVSLFAFAVGGSVSGAVLPRAKTILDYGAKPDGRTMSTKAIQQAIDETAGAGGGTVYAPPGVYLVGGLELKSRVTLYLESGCTLLGSTSIEDYQYHPGPPAESGANGFHLLFAQKSENVTLCGTGIIDGQGQAYWQPKSKRPPEAWKDISSQDFEARNNKNRPSPMIEFAQCRNVQISGITFKNSPSWTIRPIACDGVLIDRICIRNPSTGVNGDGIDVTCSRNVVISNCDIAAGDDAICLKSDNPYGELLPTKNVAITNCLITTPCNGFKIGTASKGAFENIAFSNSIIYADSASPSNTHPVSGISIEMVDGGTIDGVVVSNIRMQNVRAPVFVRLSARQRKPGSFLRDILIENVDAAGAIITSSITGVPGLRPSDITISNCRFRTIEQGQADWSGHQIPEAVDSYPEAWMMGRLPAYAFFIRHADRIRLRNVECIADRPDGRPAIVCNDAEDLTFAGLEFPVPAGNAPLIELQSVRRAFITGMRAPPGSKVIAQISGADSSGVSFAGNTFQSGPQTVVYADGATAEASGR